MPNHITNIYQTSLHTLPILEGVDDHGNPFALRSDEIARQIALGANFVLNTPNGMQRVHLQSNGQMQYLVFENGLSIFDTDLITNQVVYPPQTPSTDTITPLPPLPPL